MNPEFGNEQACTNCGDEWSALIEGLCQECRETLEGCETPESVIH